MSRSTNIVILLGQHLMGSLMILSKDNLLTNGNVDLFVKLQSSLLRAVGTTQVEGVRKAG